MASASSETGIGVQQGPCQFIDLYGFNVDVPWCKGDEGLALWQIRTKNDSAQAFYPTNVEDDYYTIEPQCSKLNWEIKDNSKVVGGELIQNRKTGLDNQLFKFIPVPGKENEYRISCKISSGLVIGTKDNSSKEEAHFVQVKPVSDEDFKKNNTDAAGQIFKIVGSFRPKTSSDNKNDKDGDGDDSKTMENSCKEAQAVTDSLGNVSDELDTAIKAMGNVLLYIQNHSDGSNMNDLLLIDESLTKNDFTMKKIDAKISELKGLFRSSELAVDAVITPDTSNYKEWNYEKCLRWIMSLEKGRFSKYKGKLEETLKKVNMTGADLTSVGKSEWINDFGVTTYSDATALKRDCDALKNK